MRRGFFYGDRPDPALPVTPYAALEAAAASAAEVGGASYDIERSSCVCMRACVLAVVCSQVFHVFSSIT